MRRRRRPAVAALVACIALSVAGRARASEAKGYQAAREQLESSRLRLADDFAEARTPQERAEVLEQAHRAVLAAMVGRLFPSWLGTRWDFYGTSETPGEGAIACGYFVSTVLRDAGFRVERVRLAQQASENIVKTLTPPAQVRRYRWKRPSQVVEAVREELGPGLFVVGLDYHVGFLQVEAERATFCHSAWLEPATVVCEPAASALGLESDYTVVGRLLTPSMLTRWLEARAFPTRGAMRR